MTVRRRVVLRGLAALAAWSAQARGAAGSASAARAAAAAGTDADAPYPVVVPGRALQFPADFGSHPDFRTEWWYVTGWLRDAAERALGVQVTFFRHRPRLEVARPSRFAPRQLLFAHAAIADPERGTLLHDQRAARAGFGLAEAAVGTTDVVLGAWSLRREADAYVARIPAAGFAIELRCAVTQAPLLQGDQGYSRKGPEPGQASYYYSEPHLAVTGAVTLGGHARPVRGQAWCDHEWSSEYLPAAAVGWDWAGINFDDGSALMAFVMRRADGTALWAGGTLRDAAGARRTFGPTEVRFTPRSTWRSPRTGTAYPVAMRLDAGDATYDLDPLFADQELDSRRSTGTIYWEGAVRVRQAAGAGAGAEAGRGYLELTGYAGRVRT